MSSTDPGTPGVEVGTYLIQWRFTDGQWLRATQVATTPQPLEDPREDESGS